MKIIIPAILFFVITGCKDTAQSKSAEKLTVSETNVVESPPAEDSAEISVPMSDNNTKFDESLVGKFVADKSCGCNLAITIRYENNAYKYVIENGKSRATGTARIDESRGDVYIILEKVDGKKDLEAASFGDYIAMQNYGNIMNKYNFFENCDCKYIELGRQ